MMCRLWALLSVVIAERYSQGVDARWSISYCWPQCLRGKSVIKSARAPVCGIFKHQWIILRSKAVVGWVCVKVFVNRFLPKQSFRRREGKAMPKDREICYAKKRASSSTLLRLARHPAGAGSCRLCLPVCLRPRVVLGTGWVMLLPCVLGLCLVWSSPKNPGLKKRWSSWTCLSVGQLGTAQSQ